MQAQRLLIATALFTFGACNLWEPKVVCSDGTRCPDGMTCAADQDICITGSCGNGAMDAEELCDDGNIQSDDGCRSDCMSLEICGDGVLEERLSEVCDDGNTESGDGCSGDCRSNEECGNGIIDPQTGEICDDGNMSGLDGCRSDCKSLEICGDGVTDETIGEKCDDGNTKSNDGCSSDCVSDETCGNGVIDLHKGEACDHGNTVSGDGCSSDCVSDETCGNGIVDLHKGEVCDHGDTVSGDGCSSDCVSDETCGNGVTDEYIGEACDDANTLSDDGCSGDCLSDETCGNGIIDRHKEEVCDHGNRSERDGCSMDCLSLCGDGDIGGTEQCDSDDVEMFCSDYPSFDMGRLGCNDNCQHTTDTCVSFGFASIQPPADRELLHAIWADADGDGYAVGNAGTIIAFSRTESSRETIPDVFSGTSFQGVWGGGNEGPVYVVGDSGAILTRDTEGWKIVSESGTPDPGDPDAGSPDPGDPDAGNPDAGIPDPPDLKGVWGYTHDGVTTAFAVGTRCTIRKLTGNTWTAEPVPDDCQDDSLQAVSGTGRDDIYAVSSSRILRRNDSGEWEHLPLNGVTDAAHTDIWVGTDGTVFLAGKHIYKCAYQEMLSGQGPLRCASMDYSGEPVRGIWGSSPHDLFAVAGNTVFHSNGFLEDEWTTKTHWNEDLNDIHGSSAFDIFVASDKGILHGTLPWREMDSVYSNLLSVWASATTTYVAGETGIFRLDDHDAWERVASVQGEIHGLWGIDSSQAFAVGYEFDSGENATVVDLLLLCGEDECTHWQAPTEGAPYLRSVWASDADSAFVVGDDGVALHFDVSSRMWRPMGEIDPSIDLHDIWGSDMQTLFTVGSSGTILHYSDEVWARESLPLIYERATLFAIWGIDPENIFAVGEYGAILRRTAGGDWEDMASPTFATLYDIGGIVTEDGQIKLFAVGYDGLVLYYDGVAWSEVRTSTTADFDGVWVTPTEAFMVADDGDTYRLRHSHIEAPSLE